MSFLRGGVWSGPIGVGLLSVLVFCPTPVSAQDSWDAIYLSGQKVGHIHTFVAPVKDKGRELVRVRVDMVLSFKRDKDRVTTEIRYGTIETPEGAVLRLDSRTLASKQEMRTFGDVIDNQMTLTLEGAGQKQQLVIPWGPDVRGPYAAEQNLSRSPIKAGESRSIRSFIPDLNKVCDMTLAARAPEVVELGGGEKRSLMRVEQTAVLEGKPRPEFSMTYWVDAGGQVLKSSSDNMGGMVTYRTTREAATSPDGAGTLDLLVMSVIKVTRKIPRSGSSRDIVYRVALKDESPVQIFPNDRRQAIQLGGLKSSAILRVKTAGPNDGPEGPEAVDKEFLQPNSLVTSADERVISLARQAVGDAVDQWDKVVRIERWVAANMKNKNFATAFAPASEVARNLSGDCTEHGVLTAALCRAVGIPARVAIGLVYVDHLGGFGYHLWNEVYVNRRWVAIDATFDQTEVDAVHLKLSDSSLAGVSPYEAFLPVARVMNKLTLEPQEVR